MQAGKPQRSYSHAIASAHRTITHMEQMNHESTRNMMKLFLGIILAAGLLATFGVVFYISTNDGSKVQGTTWRTSSDDPVAVSAAVSRVSMDDEFGALVEESRRRRRRLEEGGDFEESSLTDSPQCASLRATTDKMKRIFVTGEEGESFSCKIGSTMVNCEGVTASFTCETGEKVAYSPDGERRLGVVSHPEGETEHSLMTNEEHHVHGRTLWFWKFLAAIFGIQEVEAEVEEEFESRPNKAIDCATSSWSGYGYCDYNYDGNGNWMNRNFGSTRCVQIRSRTITTHAAHGGRSCGDLSQTRTCSCPSVIDDKITSEEECDDGNSINGDGCSSNQKIESGFFCSPSAPTSSSYFVNAKSQCHGMWNNGVIEHGEDCDDGNDVDGDGCHNGVRDPKYICAVQNQPCTKARIRRDWNQLEVEEKKLYISAINDLKKSGIYDDFVHVHGLTNNKEYAHGTGGFLPWHRWYLFQFEEALRNQNTKYKDLTIPYWDWGEEADLCAAKGGCRYLNEESEIITDFGGPGTSQTSMGRDQAFAVDFAEGQLGGADR
jgi:cysteine-rich repeat protein